MPMGRSQRVPHVDLRQPDVAVVLDAALAADLVE
jgi:hypothetical protein